MIVYNTLVFCLVLFLYLHIYFHLKTSNDLEIFELSYPSKDKLEEVCDLRQPARFDFNNERIIDGCKRETILKTYGGFDVKLRNVKENYDDEEVYIPVTLKNAIKAIDGDDDNKYLTENNGDFLEETGLVKTFKYNDAFIRPHMVSNCIYDLCIGSDMMQTPFRYNVNYRNYFTVVEGAVSIKLAPPKSKKYLYVQNDYDNFEFRSPVNPWNVQEIYKADFDKVKCLEVRLEKGQMFFIPAYWFYSIKFEKDTTMCSFCYKTYMNNISIFPLLFMQFLQMHNTKRNTVPNITTKQGNENNETVEVKQNAVNAVNTVTNKQ